MRNFLIKKLGLKDGPELDEAIQDVMDQMGKSNRNKYRAMVYYLLTLKFNKASIYNPEMVRIGSNVRIDDFCMLSGEITLHNYIHVSAYSALYGKFGIELHDLTLFRILRY